MFTSDTLHLEPSGRTIHYIQSRLDGPTSTGSPQTPLVALHGLGGYARSWKSSASSDMPLVLRSSSFWLPVFQSSNVAKTRAVVAYDSDGHGLSSWSGREKLSMDDLADDLKTVLDELKLERVILLVHSMSGVSAIVEH